MEPVTNIYYISQSPPKRLHKPVVCAVRPQHLKNVNSFLSPGTGSCCLFPVCQFIYTLFVRVFGFVENGAREEIKKVKTRH